MTSMSPLKALVVDDNQINRFLLLKITEALGMAADEAENGREAVEKARAAAYAIILMDIAMPVLDGVEATREIRAAEIATPIVAVSAHVGPSDTESLRAAGFDACMAKPFDVAALSETISRLARAQG